MNCPNCKAYNPSNANYCAQCGVAMIPPDDEARHGREQRPEVLHGYEAHDPGASPRIELIPTGVGQLISGTFRIYQASFRPLVTIALLGQIPLFLSAFASSEAVVASLTLAGIFTGLLADGASTYAVARRHVRLPVAVATSYQAAFNNAVALLLATIVFISAMALSILLMLVVIGIPLFFFVLVVWFFYVQAIIVERQGPLTALRRSWTLVRGSWWRVFGIGVTFVTVLAIVGIVAFIPGVILSFANAILGNLLFTAGTALVAPLGYIGATLVYFDLRIRKEGYTLETLASEVA